MQRPGSEIVLYGTVACQSDIPKKCFSTTFSADDRKAMDYFNCKSCRINCEIVSVVFKYTEFTTLVGVSLMNLNVIIVKYINSIVLCLLRNVCMVRLSVK